MINWLVELENNLAKADTAQQCDAALINYLYQKGITTFSFTYYAHHPNSSNKLKYDMCSDNFRHWHKHYLEQNYHYIDSTLRFTHHNHLPVYWNLQQQLAQASNDKERQMRLDSIEFGAEAGLSIPIHGAQNNFATLLLVQMQHQTCCLHDSNEHYEFFVAAHYYYHYLQIHLINDLSDKPLFQLTQREIQCLILIAKEYSVKEMAQYLELSERTINFHLQKAIKKLGVKNKYLALAKALEYQLLTL